MTTVAEEDVLTAAELELTVDPITETATTSEAADPAAAAPEAAEQPFFRVVKGSPSDDEVAALVAVFTALASSGGAAGPTGPADNWGRPTLLHRGSSPFSPYSFPQLSHLR